MQSLGALPLTRFMGQAADALPREPESDDAALLSFVDSHRKSDGGYGWLSRVGSHVTPTFAAVAIYRMLGRRVPDRDRLVSFVRAHYPVPDGLSQQPLWRLAYEQAQLLVWLGSSMDTSKSPQWQKPLVYNTYFEQNGYPTLQHQAMAVRLRRMAGIDDAEATNAWTAYFRARQRSNGTFNNTPASDGSGGHVVNTLWAVEALSDLGVHEPLSEETVAWLQHCQRPGGGFTWSPRPELGGVENVIYTWAAVRLLARSGQSPRDRQACVGWLEDRRGAQGGYSSSHGSRCNLTATWYAVKTLAALRSGRMAPVRPQSSPQHSALPRGLSIYTAQIEAPGSGSPAEAAMLAERLKIDLWTAKNASPGWIGAAQQVARARGGRTLFAQGNEEYGTYTEVPGFGTYSHLDDLVAPPAADLGPFPPQRNVGMPWTTFREQRIRKVRAHDGRMVWQFNENEELTRILLDDACSSKSYSAISSFHFGLDDFLEFEPFLMDWEGRLPMIGLQDAHGEEAWWWAPQLANFCTLYLAEGPSWEGFVGALDRGWCLSVRHVSESSALQWSGARPEVRQYIEERQDQWIWWKKSSPVMPLAAVTLVDAGAPFEAGTPTTGRCVRVRLQWDLGSSPNKPEFVKPLSELVRLSVDGTVLNPITVATQHDRYLLAQLPDVGAHRVSAVLRDLCSSRTETINLNPSTPQKG